MMTTQFVERLAARDFDALAATMAPDARARLLLPRGFEEAIGRDDIVDHLKTWFGSASKFDLVSSSDDAIGSRQMMTWRFDVVRGGRPELIEQLVFVDSGPEGISHIDLLCSGFQASEPVSSCEVRSFDAGTMGCSDGLAEEFRRKLADVPLGGRLEVVVRDPAAKEDLPSMARLLGHSVTSSQATADGRLTIIVEKKR